MPWGFEEGGSYNRRIDIHERFGGQRQGGIITPSAHNVIFIMTGRRGADFGYDDRFHADGSVEYFGEGQVGDMQMIRGNRAIAEHARDGKDLLLFEKEYPSRTLKLYDEMVCEGWHWEDRPDAEGRVRRAIVFELRPMKRIIEVIEATTTDKPAFEVLRERAMAAAAPSKPGARSLRTVFERSADVRNYVMARAGAICEGCEDAAPFHRKDGSPYLEAHHIRRASDGGLDDPRFVIALCPNCHCRVHRGADGEDYNAQLLRSMRIIEAA